MLDSNGKPLTLAWNYTRAELVADGIVHSLGIVLALVGTTALVVLAASQTGPVEFATVLIYGATLVAGLCVSAAYNMWPISATKWMLRRFDHATIFLLIAGTYTPLLVKVGFGPLSTTLLVGVWVVALMGGVLKIAYPGHLDRLAILLYLAMGWSGVMALDLVIANLPAATVWLICIGGALYSLGVIFHVWERLRFQNAIWHSFVLVAAACHYGAILDCIVLTRA